jgi:hypothetical protein
MSRLDLRPDTKPFKDLLDKPEDFNRVFTSLEHTIMGSFAIDVAVLGVKPEITKAKVKARWDICEKWFRVMRGDIGFGLIETLDMIPKALACELLDQPFNPEKEANRGWAPQSIDGVLKKA